MKTFEDAFPALSKEREIVRPAVSNHLFERLWEYHPPMPKRITPVTNDGSLFRAVRGHTPVGLLFPSSMLPTIS